MRPLAVLLGIITGSAVAIALGLAMVLIIFLILLDEREQLRAELGPLLQGIGLFLPLAAAAAASFAGELRQARWRWGAMAAMVVGILLVGWVYWPRSLS